MGIRFEALCNKCGHSFSFENGGGFSFHLLRCDRCSETKGIRFDEVGELHLAYLKGLSVPYCIASSDHDDWVRENYEGEPVPEDYYHEEIEKMMGKCKCGGQFKFNSPPRCPKCHCTDIKESGMIAFYD